MLPSPFDRTIPKGAAGAGSPLMGGNRPTSASFIVSQATKKSNVILLNAAASTHQLRRDDSDDATDSDDDVLKMTDQSITNQRRRRNSSVVMVSSAGSFATPQQGQHPRRGADDDNNNTNNGGGGDFLGGAPGPARTTTTSTGRSLADKFFDPKLVRLRAESQRRKSQKALESGGSAAATLSEEAQALGPASYKTAEKSAKLNSGELKCSVGFAPCISCLDENPSDILRPQVPPSVEHATMVSFESESLLIIFGGLCANQNDAKARATVDTSSSAKSNSKSSVNSGNKKGLGIADDDERSTDRETGSNPEVSEMPVAGVASNTTWIYDTRNLVWTCLTETDLDQQQQHEKNKNSAPSSPTCKSSGGALFGPKINNSNITSTGSDDDDSPKHINAGVCPAPRCGHTAVAMFDDPLPKKTHLPSASRASPVHHRHHHRHDHQQQQQQSNKKSRSSFHGDAPNEYTREPMMVIFGGCDLRRQVTFGDVWAFFPRFRRWKCLFDCAAVPRGNLTFSLDLIPTDPNDFKTKKKMSFFPDDADFFAGEDVRARLLALTGKVTGAKLHAAATARRPVRKANPPCQRWKAVSGALDELLFVFGGESSTFEVLDDLHTFNVLTQQWEVMRTRMSPWPSARFMHSACVVGTKMIVSGGTGKRSDVVMEDDTWILEMRTVMWRQVMGTSEVLNSAASSSDALERCPFLTRPRHVQQLPVMVNSTEKRLDLKSSLQSQQQQQQNQSNWSQQRRQSSSSIQVARCEVEGPVLLPFDDRIVFFGGREVPTGRFVNSTFVLDLISERWFRADDVMMDQSNLHIHGDVSLLSPLPVTERTDSMLPAKRWAHCGCAVVKYSATRSMNLARTLSEVAQECGGNNICGTVRFTDQAAIDRYILELQKDVLEQANFDGVLSTRNSKPIMSRTLRAFFFGGGATCSGFGASGSSRRAELSDCWQMQLTLK